MTSASGIRVEKCVELLFCLGFWLKRVLIFRELNCHSQLCVEVQVEVGMDMTFFSFMVRHVFSVMVRHVFSVLVGHYFSVMLCWLTDRR